MNVESEAFFRFEDGHFSGNDGARSPWQEDACHGGPVAGLVARSLESMAGGKRLVRATIAFRRAVPIGGISLHAETIRDGRLTAESRVEVRDRDGRICAVGSGLHIAESDARGLPTAPAPPPEFDPTSRGHFPVDKAMHKRPFFTDAVEVAYPPGKRTGSGPAVMWMRTPPIVAGETPTPFQRACPIADCGNGISQNAGFGRASFVNPDLTIALHRLPTSDWLASDAVSHWQPDGIGLAIATLYDREGAIGSALQTLIIRRN